MCSERINDVRNKGGIYLSTSLDPNVNAFSLFYVHLHKFSSESSQKKTRSQSFGIWLHNQDFIKINIVFHVFLHSLERQWVDK